MNGECMCHGFSVVNTIQTTLNGHESFHQEQNSWYSYHLYTENVSNQHE